jgi:metal-responsive CopG/Arc/MetJ family transcriptional regulator
MEGKGHNMDALPKINVSLSDRERARLERLARLRGGKRSRVIADAVTHMLASIEMKEPIHYVVPSEDQTEREAQRPDEG